MPFHNGKFQDNFMGGTYYYVKDQGYLDFCVAQGLPKEAIEPMVGTHWRIVTQKVNDTWTGWNECYEMPALNLWFAMDDGEIKEFEWYQLGPGKQKLSAAHFDNGGLFQVLGAPVGWTETYSEVGLVIDCLLNGKSTGYKELWKRDWKNTGWFRFAREENVGKVLKQIGWSDDLIAKLPSFKWHITSDGGDSYKWKEIVGKDVFDAQFDASGKMGTFKQVNSTDKPMMRGLKCVRKGDNQLLHEFYDGDRLSDTWSMKVLLDGSLELEGTNVKTGEKAKLWMEPFTEYLGKWKLVIATGWDGFGEAVGMSPGQIQKSKEELDVHMTIKEEDGWTHVSCDSKINATDYVFVWDKEYTMYWDGMKGKEITCLDTWTGTKHLSVKKVGDLTIKMETVFTYSFARQTCEVVGVKDSKITSLFKREFD